MCIKLRKEKIISPLEPIIPDPKEKDKKGKGKGEIVPVFDILEEIEIKEKVRLKYEIWREDKLLLELDNYNTQVLNFFFDATPYVPEIKGKKGEGNIVCNV